MWNSGQVDSKDCILALYRQLETFILFKVKKKGKRKVIGVLDIYGFEIFRVCLDRFLCKVWGLESGIYTSSQTTRLCIAFSCCIQFVHEVFEITLFYQTNLSSCVLLARITSISVGFSALKS